MNVQPSDANIQTLTAMFDSREKMDWAQFIRGLELVSKPSALFENRVFDDLYWRAFMYVHTHKDDHEFLQNVDSLGEEHKKCKEVLLAMLGHVRRGLVPTFSYTGQRTITMCEELSSISSILSRIERLTIKTGMAEWTSSVERVQVSPSQFSVSSNDKNEYRLKIKDCSVDPNEVRLHTAKIIDRLVMLIILDKKATEKDLEAYSKLFAKQIIVLKVPYRLEKCDLKALFPNLNPNFHYEH